jgi:hypothetical protein
MLLSEEIDEVIRGVMAEAKRRAPIKAVIPEELLHDKQFWDLVSELFVAELHRYGCVIVKQNGGGARSRTR